MCIMGRTPWIALLLCVCSCSLDTSPDIPSAAEGDASLSLKQQASLRFDAPPKPRKETAGKRGRRDDADAGDDNSDAKPESRDAGRPASARPAMLNARDAGGMDAGDKPTSMRSVSTDDVSDDRERADAAASEPAFQMTEPSSHDGGADRAADEPRGREQHEHSAHGRGGTEGDRAEFREARGKHREPRSDDDAYGNDGKHRRRDR